MGQVVGRSLTDEVPLTNCQSRFVSGAVIEPDRDNGRGPARTLREHPTRKYLNSHDLEPCWPPPPPFPARSVSAGVFAGWRRTWPWKGVKPPPGTVRGSPSAGTGAAGCGPRCGERESGVQRSAPLRPRLMRLVLEQTRGPLPQHASAADGPDVHRPGLPAGRSGRDGWLEADPPGCEVEVARDAAWSVNGDARAIGLQPFISVDQRRAHPFLTRDVGITQSAGEGRKMAQRAGRTGMPPRSVGRDRNGPTQTVDGLTAELAYA